MNDFWKLETTETETWKEKLNWDECESIYPLKYHIVFRAFCCWKFAEIMLIILN